MPLPGQDHFLLDMSFFTQFIADQPAHVFMHIDQVFADDNIQGALAKVKPLFQSHANRFDN